MKRLMAMIVLVLLLMTNTVYATGLDGWLGGLTSMFGTKNEVTYGVGEPVTVDNITITLVDVLQSGATSYYAPEEGNGFLILEFEIKNEGSEQVVLSSMLNFSMLCDEQVYTISLEALGIAMFAGKIQLDTVIEPGKTVNGVVGYEVPKDWKRFDIDFKTEVYFGETVTFAVER